MESWTELVGVRPHPFIHSSTNEGKLNVKCVQNLIFLHSNLQFWLRNSDQYETKKTNMWDTNRGEGILSTRVQVHPQK